MSSFLSSFRTDKNAEENGTWVKLSNETSVKVRRFSNTKAQKLLETLRKPYRSFRDGVPTDAMEEIMRKVTAKEVVVDWTGVQDPETEKDLPFSPEAAEKVFVALPDFYRIIVDLSLAKETFLADNVESVKNA